MLRVELERLTEIRLQVGGALARNAIDEIERDVVKTGITKMVESTPDGVRMDNTFEHLEQVRLETLNA
jgi:hypothetical protein